METETVWTFETARFRIELRAHDCESPDLSWDEDGSVADGIHDGDLIIFDAQVVVLLDGCEIASDWLGQCIYRSMDDLIGGHRDPDPMNRNSTLMRAAKGSNVIICHYFPSMVREAVRETRLVLGSAPQLRSAA